MINGERNQKKISQRSFGWSHGEAALVDQGSCEKKKSLIYGKKLEAE